MTVRVPDVDDVALWLAEGRTRKVDSLSPGDIGGLPHRLRLLLRTIVDGVTYIERKVAPSVGDPLGRHLVDIYALDTAYADNAYGRSSVSAPRMGALLGLHERTVRRVRDLLVQLHLQGREGGGRGGDRHWPIIPRHLADPRVSPAWWLDATSRSRALPLANPDTQACPDLPRGYGRGNADMPPPLSGHGAPKSGHAAYASRRDFNALARPDVRRLQGEREATPLSPPSDTGARDALAAPASLRPRTVDGQVDPDAERLAQEVREWAMQRRPPSADAVERVRAMTHEALARLCEEDRKRRAPEVVQRVRERDAELRLRHRVTSTQLEEALANLRRMQTGDRG